MLTQSQAVILGDRQTEEPTVPLSHSSCITKRSRGTQPTVPLGDATLNDSNVNKFVLPGREEKKFFMYYTEIH